MTNVELLESIKNTIKYYHHNAQIFVQFLVIFIELSINIRK
jgi:hypothetical protein